jgi:uncharacterized phage infection (PIP) family protein YhgE
MVYESAEEMETRLNNAVAGLQELISDMESIANAMEQGDLLGAAGEAFANGIRGPLTNGINSLIEGYQDGARYVRQEIEDHKSAESQSAGLF